MAICISWDGQTDQTVKRQQTAAARHGGSDAMVTTTRTNTCKAAIRSSPAEYHHSVSSFYRLDATQPQD